MTGAEFAYVQARLQARHGAMPGATTWQALEASHTPGHYLALARAGTLSAWVSGLGESGDTHRIEQQLRVSWQRYVDDIAAWQPAPWRAATRWFAGLPELPLTEAPAYDGDTARWLNAWLQLMPRGAALPALLRRVALLLMPGLSGLGQGAGAGLAGAPPAGRAASAEPVRRALQGLFRRHAASPVAVFAHLALVALDVERLRGGIVTRTLFDSHRAPGGAPREA